MKYYIFILIIILYINTNILYSQESIDNNAFYLDLKAILENHPKIQSQTMSLAYKLEEYRYKKTYYPDPRFGIMWSTVPYNKKLKFEFDKSPMSGIEYSLIQPIPTPGKLTLESKITEKEIELERIKLAEEYNKTTEKILMLWVSYYASKELDLILNQYYDKFKTLTESSKAKYTTGKGNYTDLSKAILLENKLKEERIAIKGNIENLKENLNYYYSIINKTNYEESTYYDSIKQYIESLYKTLPENHIIYETTYYNLAKILPEIDEKKIQLQKYEYYPDFELFLSYRETKKIPDDPKSGENFMSAGISFRIPLWSALSNPKAVQSQEMNLKKTKFDLAEVELNLKTRLKELNIEIQTLKNRQDLYKNVLIPQAELSFNSGLQNYMVGKIDFEGFSLILMDLLNLEKEYINLRKELDVKIIEYLQFSNLILPEIHQIQGERQ